MTSQMQKLNTLLGKIDYELVSRGCEHYVIYSKKQKNVNSEIRIWHNQIEFKISKTISFYADLKTCKLDMIDSNCLCISLNVKDKRKYPFILIDNNF